MSVATSFEVIEPATGAPLAQVAACGEAEVDAAVAAARRAFEEDWRWHSPQERGALLKEVAARIREHADELATLLTRENGKPVRDSRAFDVEFSHRLFDYFASLTETLHGKLLAQGPINAEIEYEPYGVVAAILPFNWPPIHFGNKCAAALAAGNTVVIKPGEQAPLTVLRLVELANEVLPAGVLNAVTGIAAGPPLSSHPGIDRITFTGSTGTGRRVLQGAAQSIVPATMELGGKNALIVFEDADLDAALKGALDGMFFNKGEACTSTARILVHDSVHDRLLERFAAATERLTVGDGLDAGTDIGPVVDQTQRDRIRGYLDLVEQEGARIVAQAPLPEDPRLAGGYFIAPTVVADVAPGSRLALEEIFGPVACFMRFSEDEEALAIANETEYGLTAAFFTQDRRRTEWLVPRLEAGIVFVNNYFRGSMLGSPFGGNKASGFGREQTDETLWDFVRPKNVRYPRGDAAIPHWATAEKVWD